MAEIVNLRSRRKAKARLAREKVAEANRALHGSPKAERVAAKHARSHAERVLDGHLREGREHQKKD